MPQPEPQRQPLDLMRTGREIIIDLAEGNFGALRVLTELAIHHTEEFSPLALLLEDMNIRGSQLWLAYSHFAMPRAVAALAGPADPSEDLVSPDLVNSSALSILVEAIQQRDEAMVTLVNERSGYPEYCEHRAVRAGTCSPANANMLQMVLQARDSAPQSRREARHNNT